MPTEITFIFKKIEGYTPSGLGARLILAELMIMASHQTISGQLWHLTDQTKFDQQLHYTLSMGKPIHLQ